jgi:hypothetical protein
VREFAEHCTGIARKRVEKDREARTMRTKMMVLPTGQVVYRWVRLKVDHFRQAYSYECMARGDMLPIRPSQRRVRIGKEAGPWK